MKKILLLIFAFFFISCATTKQTEVKPIQIKTEFPNPVDENGNNIVTLEVDGSVKMPLWYWLRITDYVIDVETNNSLRK